MIGHYLGTLTTEQEDWVLTGTLTAFYGWPDGIPRGPCLLQRAHAEYRTGTVVWGGEIFAPCDVGAIFDALYHRFGAKRITAAIRQRILANRAYRELTRPAARNILGAGMALVGSTWPDVRASVPTEAGSPRSTPDQVNPAVHVTSPPQDHK